MNIKLLEQKAKRRFKETDYISHFEEEDILKLKVDKWIDYRGYFKWLMPSFQVSYGEEIYTGFVGTEFTKKELIDEIVEGFFRVLLWSEKLNNENN